MFIVLNLRFLKQEIEYICHNLSSKEFFMDNVKMVNQQHDSIHVLLHPSCRYVTVFSTNLK